MAPVRKWLPGVSAAVVLAGVVYLSGGLFFGQGVGSFGPEGALAQSKPQKPVASTPVAKLPPGLSDTMKTFDAITKKAMAGDYLSAQWHPIHFKPAIDKSNDADCLVCHKEILDAKPLATSPAGVPSKDVLAWYQTLSTFTGGQDDFHVRHLTTPYSKEVMNLKCNFCHQGNDPREESPHVTVIAADLTSNNSKPPFTLRKMVNPEETCLRCHGSFPWQNMTGMPGPWEENRADLEPEGVPNGCLSCHSLIRTNRHQVNYLKTEAIEKAAESNSDVCYGCHGGRHWYRISYPYPRHAWPDMPPPEDTPDWAKDRPTVSDPRYQVESAVEEGVKP